MRGIRGLGEDSGRDSWVLAVISPEIAVDISPPMWYSRETQWERERPEMHSTIDYSKSPCAAFDAVEDIKQWLGPERYSKIAPEMAKLTHCGAFAMYCSLAGIQGFPVKAWYEHFQGQGKWKPEELD